MAFPIFKWAKLLLPQKQLRFYPPSFDLRNPIMEGVTKVLTEEHHVAILVFKLTRYEQLLQHINEPQTIASWLRRLVKNVVIEVVADEDIVALNNDFTDVFTLFIRFKADEHSVVELDRISRKISERLVEYVSQIKPFSHAEWRTGYMFIEKSDVSLQTAVYRAFEQALIIAERNEHSQYNEILFELTNVIQNKSISLLTQPIIDVKNGEVRAWEILTRGPAKSTLESPLQLFSFARQMDKLYDLEMIVLEKAFQKIVETGCRQLMFINFTPKTLDHFSLIADVERLLTKYKTIEPSQITIEVTERDSIEDVVNLKVNIRQLRQLGFRIAVDDTGAGYASLHTISEIMPDIIKIDRSVIQDIDTNRVKESMLKGLLLIAQETGSLVVAEGIEKEGEASVCARNDVHLVQGYYYAKPGKWLESC